jgi:hypothetical protein
MVGMTNQEQTQEETQTEEQIIENRELTEEELKNIIKDILANPSRYPEESRLLLRIVEDVRPGGGFTRYRSYKLIYGKVEDVVLSEYEDYPYSHEVEHVLIPKTKYVVILERYYDETANPTIERAYLHVFSSKTGWRVVEL